MRPDEVPLADRPFASALSPDDLAAMQQGTMRSRYRGVPMLKSPLDIGIYLQLFSRLEPRSVLEVGTNFGGGAVFFADLLAASGVDGRVVTVDLEPPDIDDDRIDFVRGDAAALGETAVADLLPDLPRPLVVIEDSAHTYEVTLAVLRFVAPHLVPDDHVVVEDGIVSQLPDVMYRRYDDGPNRAVRAFLAEQGGDFEVATELCDFYGYNATWSPNGWLRRV